MPRFHGQTQLTVHRGWYRVKCARYEESEPGQHQSVPLSNKYNENEYGAVYF